MEKRHMKFSRLLPTLLFSLLFGGMLTTTAFADITFDASVTVDTAETSSDSSGGDVVESQCASLDESLAAALGCDTSDEVIDFTTFDGGLDAPDTAGYDEKLTQNTNAREFIQSIVNYALGFLGLVATVTIIYGGIMYVLSRGDEDMASKGKKSISYAAMGIVIILASFAIVNTLLEAGGGNSSGNGDGTSGGDGTTITETGASFDTDYVLTEIEDVSKDYLTQYYTILEVSREVSYMKSTEVPIVVDVEETDWTLGGLAEYAYEWATGSDSDYADQYTLIDENDVEDYLDTMRDGIQNIQSSVDSLSTTYESAQNLYNYLKSGSTSSIFDTLWAAISERASAASSSSGSSYSVEELVERLSKGETTTTACNKRSYDSSSYQDSLGLGVNVYEVDIREIDDDICGYLDAIQEAADTDYVTEVQDLVERFEELQALFDTEGQGFDSGSKLTKVLTAFESADEKLNTALTTVSASGSSGIVDSMNELHNLVENLDFVKVRLSASTTEGNAPLIVRYDMLGTEDPSGKTVEDSQIQWDLNGDGTFETTGSLDSSAVTSADTEGDSVSATYLEPGTYRVRVRVLSQDEDIAAGISTVSIKVDPPKSAVVLTATPGSGEATTIADFREFPYTDQQDYKVTMTEAQSGITFDASQTEDGDGNTGSAGGIIYYEWDFGDNDTSAGPYGQEGGSTVTHAYGEAGNYNVSLTVTDDTGVQDAKYFTLYVASPAARFNVTPASGTVGTEFEFDGSVSTTDVGRIASYSWSATKDGAAVTLNSTTGDSITSTFDEPGVYDVTLTVSDGSGKTDTASYQVLVESTPPVATFEYSVPNENEPGTYVLDASKSYDLDEGDTLTYEWDFTGEENTDYKILDSENDGQVLTVQFLTVDEFDVLLTVYDDHEAELKKSDTAQATLNITSILDVNLDIDGETARHLDENGESEVEFTAASETATAFQIDYGDGVSDYTDSITRGQTVFTHTYSTAGVFNVSLTALNDEDQENSMTRRVYIGAGDAPIAVLNVYSEGEDIGYGSSLTGSVKTQFTFDAGSSVNTDGSNDGLVYSWNFGDGVTSSQESVTHKFSETANYTITLTVRDENDSSITDTTTMTIAIEGIDPQIHGITVVPQGDTLETPLKVNISVDAEDEDGTITYYKAWYYDLNDTAKQLSPVIAQTDSFTLTVNTKGVTGETVAYGFAVEVTDNENNTVASYDELDPSEVPTLTVTNGPNESPVPGFTVDHTTVYVGEEVNFSSSSYDPDGNIVSYTWDVEGNGFYDNEAQESPSYSYAFTQVHTEGVEVQLKVEDDSGATAESEPLTIYVDSRSGAPEAAFLTDISGTTVVFRNNSTIDEENGATAFVQNWDFDLATDSDGDGTPDNDVDSADESPSYTYPALGTYEAKLTVIDSTGQSDTVTQEVNVVDSSPPTADFSSTTDDKTVEFKNESTVDSAQGAEVRSYSWDFDLEADTDGDTDPENDVDATTKNPTWDYSDYGAYDVKLTIEDSFGKTDTVVQTVDVESPIQPVTALLTSTPEPNSLNQIVLDSDGQNVTFYYGAEGGSGDYTYEIDKNIFYDTNSDGVRDDDVDHDDDSSGTWKTPFYKSYGHIVVKLTVTDNETGESDIATLQVVFEGALGGANLFNATPSEMLFLILSALLTAILGTTFIFRSQLSKR